MNLGGGKLVETVYCVVGQHQWSQAANAFREKWTKFNFATDFMTLGCNYSS